MSVPEDPLDFASLLRREAVRKEPAHPADSQGLAPALSKLTLQPGGSERVAIARRADTLAPDPVPHPADTTGRHRKVAASIPLSVAFKHLTTLWPSSLRLPRAPDAPLFGIVSGGAAFVLIVGTIIVSLVQHVVPRTSDTQTDSSGALKLASVNSQRVEPPAMQESAPAVGSSSAIAPAPSRDIVDPESKVQGSSEVNPSQGVAPAVPTSVKTLASPANAPASELPKLAAMYSQPVAAQPIPLPPIPPAPPAAQRSASPSRAAADTTASISPSAPASEAAAAASGAEATQPRGDNASRRKRDQKPGTAVETPAAPVPQAARGASPSRAATETTASIAPTAPSSETKAALAGAEAAQPRSDDALRRKRDQKPGTTVETPTAPAARGASASPTVAEATASIAPTAPSSETKATATRADATQPHTDDASQHKRDQKPGNATETSSCTAGVFPGYVRASARAKSVDVQKMCADPNAPFMVSVRCLVAAAVCSDYPAEKQGRVAQKPSASNRAPSHPVTDTKADTKADTKPQ